MGVEKQVSLGSLFNLHPKWTVIRQDPVNQHEPLVSKDCTALCLAEEPLDKRP